jgi:acetylornithine deacetylase/succinyl-diaminopimelate desuccinylase-like protein
MINHTRLMETIGRTWDESIVPTLCDYVRIPNKSQNFDREWAEHGYMDKAAELMRAWCEANALPGMKVEIVRLPKRTPLLFVEIPAANGGSNDDVVLMYGHMDKQPEFTGWAEGLSPWTPVIRDGRLYGRGGADDGYAIFGSILAVRAIAEQDIAHCRCVIVIEAGEESSSPDLPAYIDALADRIGKPSLVVCLDAECGNYDQFWSTTTLRGNLVGTLRVEVLAEGVHSGMASGIVPSSFRIVRQLLSRIEDAETGRILTKELQADIPNDRLVQARAVAATLGPTVQGKVPLLPGMRAMSTDPLELILNSTWRPMLAVTGVDGIPPIHSAGNVLRPMTAFVLSIRLPPTVDPKRAAQAIKETLERDPPYGAKVTFKVESSMGGWNAPSNAPWLEAAAQQASTACFGAAAMYMGTGGSIPFMAMLSEKFPGVQFVVTGVLGPHSNAHGPNEFLDIATGKKVTGCVAYILAAHATRGES